MELFLLKLVVLFRPLASMEIAQAVFEIAGLGLFGLMVLIFLSNSATRKTIVFSAVDITILAFALWCVAIFLIYFENARITEVAKMLIPLLSYIVVKNVIQDTSQYRRMLQWMIAGFSVPLIASASLIAAGKGLDYVSYWTGIPRWQGAYTGAHNLGHSVTLFLIALVLYLRLIAADEDAAGKRSRTTTYIVFLVLAALSIYCLYMSQVRSAILGVMVFTGVYLLAYNRKLLLIGGGGLALVAFATLPYWLPVLLPDVWLVLQGRAEAKVIGSGRQTFWRENLELFASLPIDRQLAGVGIGNRGRFSEEGVFDSHNDWLDVLMQTGIVGVLLLFLLQLLILRAIMRIPGRERYAYLALFLAVNAMMFVSNSYVWRIQVSQLYFIMLAYVEVRQVMRPSTAQPTMATDLEARSNLQRYGRGIG